MSTRRSSRAMDRRDFLKLLSTTAAGALLAGCQPAPPALTATPVVNPSAAATSTAIPATTTLEPEFKALVASGGMKTYDPALIRKELARMLDSLGGLSKIVKPGAHVGIKVNLTGGTWWDTPDKPPANEYFVTHPAVVGALCELLKDAGASRLVVMDGLGDETSFAAWGYKEMAARTGAELIDLCKHDPYPGFATFPVGEKARVYDAFTLHPVLAELEVIISAAKLKVHSTTGVTLSLKNLIGLAPTSEYRRDPSQNNRSWFHGDAAFDTRLPRVVIDLNETVPVKLALIDGIMTSEGGAGPWDANLTQIKPGILLAGFDPVAADAVGTALMGFDPQAPSGSFPFVGGENHLILAREAGLGTNILSEIGIRGPSIEELKVPFKPART